MRLRFLEIPHKKIWVYWGVLFKGLGVQKGTQTPCWLRPWYMKSTLTKCNSSLLLQKSLQQRLGKSNIKARLNLSAGPGGARGRGGGGGGRGSARGQRGSPRGGRGRGMRGGQRGMRGAGSLQRLNSTGSSGAGDAGFRGGQAVRRGRGGRFQRARGMSNDLSGNNDNDHDGRKMIIQCWGYFPPKNKDAKIFERHLNPIILVFIG